MTFSGPLVSIVLPVYNGEKTLKATLDSLINQTFNNYELLIGIDGTKDSSRAIAESYKDPRITIIEHPQNLGLAHNLNILIRHTHGASKYFAMAEQDDIYVPQRLEWQVNILENHKNFGLVSGIAEFVSENNRILFPGILVNNNQFPQGELLFKYLYINQLKVVNTCMMIRKEVHLKQNLEFKNTYGNFNVDWDYVLRFALVSEVYGIPKILVRMNRKNVNHSVTSNKTKQHEASRQLLKDFNTEFSYLVDAKTYREAIKQHRKIELGHHSKSGIILYGLYYSLIYFDQYFLHYIFKRYKKYRN